MTRARIAAALLWSVLALLAWRMGLSLAALPPTGEFQFEFKGYVTLALPAFFFGSAPLWLNGHPLDLRRVCALVNQKYGADTYERWVRTVRPLQALAWFGFVAGTACLLECRRIEAPQGSYGLGLFFLSAGLGFLICRVGLRLQGHRIE
jgi:hypothetical protein